MSNRTATTRMWEYAANTATISIWWDRETGDCLMREGATEVATWEGDEGTKLATACCVVMERSGAEGLHEWLKEALTEPATGLLHGAMLPMPTGRRRRG